MESSKKRYALMIAAGLLTITLLVLLFLIKDTRADMLYGEGAEVNLGMSSLNVQLMENGKAINQEDQNKGKLLGSINESMEPGYTYEEKIAADNDGDLDEYVRIIVKKYWKDDEGKRIDMDPAMIKLSYGDKDYNDSDWVMNPGETTKEQTVYYCRKALSSGETSKPLFDGIKLDAQIAYDYSLKKSDDGKDVTAVYRYDGAQIGLEAEVQSVQSGSADKAITSAWGDTGVSVVDNEIVVK